MVTTSSTVNSIHASSSQCGHFKCACDDSCLISCVISLTHDFACIEYTLYSDARAAHNITESTTAPCAGVVAIRQAT